MTYGARVRGYAVAVLLMAAFVPVSTPVWAGAESVGNYDPSYGPSDSFSSANQDTRVSLDVANPEGTSYVTGLISDAYAICSNLAQKEYTVDCLGERLEALSKSMPTTGEYVEAKKILADTSKKLRRLARENQSTTKPVARLRNTVRGKTVMTSAITPVRTEAVASTIAQAAVIMKEAETMLLRSSANSDRRKIHYAQMAKAVGSNKILLRAI